VQQSDAAQRAGVGARGGGNVRCRLKIAPELIDLWLMADADDNQLSTSVRAAWRDFAETRAEDRDVMSITDHDADARRSRRLFRSGR